MNKARPEKKTEKTTIEKTVEQTVPIDFRNTNSLWASIAVETLARLGLQTAIICPGSRSTPLTFAFAQHQKIEALPILDERSAAFFALGCAKRQRRPVALVCTSGTAGANFYPAVIEAFESAVPLLIFTADRPHELRDCASGQTIDQHRLYGNFVKQYSELSVPAASEELLMYLRQTLVSAWRRAISMLPGPIHFNCPFRDPLPPISDDQTSAIAQTFNPQQFFSTVVPPRLAVEQTPPPLNSWQHCSRGLIIAGPAESDNPTTYCQAVSALSQTLGWPVLAEGLSPLRNNHSINPALVSTYDAILRNENRAGELVPDTVIQLGPLPISKVLRQWLQQTSPERWVIGSQRNLDPLHGTTHFLSSNVEMLAQQVLTMEKREDNCACYRQQWATYESTGRKRLDQALNNEKKLVESKIIWLLSQRLPKKTPLFIANSMPVRDVEYFWKPSDRHIQPYFSRGANGIDGTLSTAMGVAHNNRPAVLLTGDLALLHDTNGLLNLQHLSGHLTIVMINNRGGGIFEMLPVSQFEPEFEQYFVTPQQVNFEALCAAHNVEYHLIKSLASLQSHIQHLHSFQPLPEGKPPKGKIRLLNVICDRKQSVAKRKALLAASAKTWRL